MTDLSNLSKRYEIKEIIGTGTNSTVRQIKDRRTQTIYAMKETIPHFVQIDLPKRYLHPNIISVENFWLDDANDFKNVRKSSLYIVMEFGRSIQDSWHQLPSSKIIHDMVGVILFLHQNGAVHGDINLTNFVIVNDSTLKLIDFDQSGYRDYPPHRPRSPGYTAPEMLDYYDGTNISEHQHKISMAAVDLWALGVTILAYLTQNLQPFGDSDPMIVKDEILNFLQDPIQFLNRNQVEEKWHHLLQWLLDPNPIIRKQNVTAIQKMYTYKIPFIAETNNFQISSAPTEGVNHDAQYLLQNLNDYQVETEVAFLAMDLFYRIHDIYDRIFPRRYIAMACLYLAIQLGSPPTHPSLIQKYCRQHETNLEAVICIATCICISLKGRLYTPNLYTEVMDYVTLQDRVRYLYSYERYILSQSLPLGRSTLHKYRIPISLL